MEEKKERAIEKAREYFHLYGYRGSSLSALIADIGISKPTFYNYFKNKEQLFSTVMMESSREFHYRYNQQARTAANGMEKLDLFISTFAWFLDTYPVFRDLYRPGNDLMARWTASRYSKEFFAEGVEIVRSILEQGIEEGIFGKDLDPQQVAPLVYTVVLSPLTADPSQHRRPAEPDFRVEAAPLVRLLGAGVLARDDLPQP
jgi:AcrR family transcriptional regulator